jgi:hypothetical protein
MLRAVKRSTVMDPAVDVPVPQTPAEHRSFAVHTFPSSHAVPSGTGSETQPSAASHRPIAHGPGAGQVVVPPPTHLPDEQRSLVVQAFPSLQVLPSANDVNWHIPLLHALAVHGLPSLQSLAVVQGPQPAIGAVAQPLAGLQESVVQLFPSLQTSAVPARQAPALQVSAPLQALPSPQAVPLATAGNVHMPLLQVFVVQGLPSLHWLAVVQAAQPVIGVVVQPLDGLQESVVQPLPSLQTSAVPAAQVPD